MELTRRDLSLRRREIVDSQKWKWFKSIGWKPIVPQILCHTSKARNRYAKSGRRGGKTEWTAHEASAYMIAGPYRVWLVGQSYDLVYKEFRVTLRDLRNPANPHSITDIRDSKDSGHLFVRLSNGAELEGKSTGARDRSPIVGDEIDLLVLCEGARIQNLGGDDGIWETELKGNLSSRLGDLIVPTTPAGKDIWLYPRYIAAEKGQAKDSFAISWPAYENIEGFLEDVHKLKREMSPRAFKQEVLGLFVSWAGSIWLQDCRFNPEKHVIDIDYDIPEWWNRVEVIDPGFSAPLFWLAAVVDDIGNTIIVDEVEENKLLTSEVANEIREHRRMMYGDKIPQRIPIHIDPEDARFRAELREYSDMFTMGANNDVTKGFSEGAILFGADRLFVSSKCKRTIGCLENHEWDDRVDSTGEQIQKRDEWIHGSDTIRYLCLSPYITRRSRKTEVIVPRAEPTVAEIIQMGNEVMDTRLPMKVNNAIIW